jgi:DNA-binding IclR family transcriptional regulator
VSGLTVLARADSLVRILEAEGEVPVADLAGALGLPVSTTYRLLRQLVESGWVEQGGQRGTYRLGAYFLKIAARMESHLEFRSAARPRMRELLEETGCATTLLVERDDRAVCVERLVPVPSNVLVPEVGDSVPLDRGPGPLLLLALGPDHGVPAGAQARGDVGARIAAVRRAGVAIEHDAVAGTTGFAAPVRNHRGELVAALTLTTVAGGYEMATCVQDAADAVSRSLGFQGGR